MTKDQFIIKKISIDHLIGRINDAESNEAHLLLKPVPPYQKGEQLDEAKLILLKRKYGGGKIIFIIDKIDEEEKKIIEEAHKKEQEEQTQNQQSENTISEPYNSEEKATVSSIHNDEDKETPEIISIGVKDLKPGMILAQKTDITGDRFGRTSLAPGYEILEVDIPKIKYANGVNGKVEIKNPKKLEEEAEDDDQPKENILKVKPGDLKPTMILMEDINLSGNKRYKAGTLLNQEDIDIMTKPGSIGSRVLISVKNPNTRSIEIENLQERMVAAEEVCYYKGKSNKEKEIVIEAGCSFYQVHIAIIHKNLPQKTKINIVDFD